MVRRKNDNSDADWTADQESDSDRSSANTESDSDDGLDAEECERRRNEIVVAMADVERQFAAWQKLSIQVHRERITQMKTELEEICKGTAQSYHKSIEEPLQKMKMRIEVAEALKKLRFESIENSFNAEEMAAKQNFENDKRLLFDCMEEDLKERIRSIEVEKLSIDFQNQLYASEMSKKSGESSGNSPLEPATVTGPCIVYMLSEAEILEDWIIIKNSLLEKQVDRK